MSKKTILLESREAGKKIKYNFKLSKEYEEIVDKKTESFMIDAISLAVVNHMQKNPCYCFNEEYLDEFFYGDKDIEDIDKDAIVINMGEFNPLDFDTLFDFINTNTSEYDSMFNWGNYNYEPITLESTISRKAEELFEDDRKRILKEISEGEILLEYIDISKEIITTTIETRRSKKTGKVKDNKHRKKEKIKMEAMPEGFNIREIMNELLDEYNLFNTMYDFLINIDGYSFKYIYLRGLELLGQEDIYYKEIAFSGSEKEKLIFDIMLETAEAGSYLHSENYQGFSSRLYNIGPEFVGFHEGYFVDNSRYNIKHAIFYTLDLILNKKDWENLKHQIEILSALYVYLDNDKHSIEELKEIFKYQYLRKALMINGLEAVTGILYKKAQTQESIKVKLPNEPKDYYPMARKMKRKFILHIGPTNSGKTYDSLHKLKSAKSGVYLAPLRLLALEVQEGLVSDGLICSLLTGEEEDILDGAKHICSTVEKLDFSKKYDIAVIDECQMLEDKQRGSAWTSAILGVQAKEVHLCFASYARDIIVELIDYCGDSYEIVNHKRETELIVSNDDYDFIKDIEKGDALIAFSKRKVLNLAATITAKTSMKCSVLFGALPYLSRKNQFQDFIDGRTDVLITTDAIGLGVNLAIKRVVFMESSKYDGEKIRPLKTSEILQIGGRAGRRGIYDQGYIITKNKKMFDSYARNVRKIKDINIGLTHHLLSVHGELEDVIKAWQDLSLRQPFKKADISQQLQLLGRIEHLSLRKEDRYKAIFLPVNINSHYEMCLLLSYLKDMSNNKYSIKFPDKPELFYEDELKQLEEYSKAIDIYYSFCKAYNMQLDVKKVEEEREKTSSRINNLLTSSNLEVPKCNTCDKPLSWDYGRYKCSSCYSNYQYQDYGYGYNHY